ncbi:MAG: carboxypeptidase-like regulatory domain-containing protein [Myxococcaceae bacterium]
MRLVLSCLVVGVLAWSPRAEACSCQAPGPPCESMFLSTVFVGTVTNVAQLSGAAITTFEVSEVLHSRKPLGKTVAVQHGVIGSMCGLTFEPGKTYVVYAGGDEQLSTGACTRTHLFKKNDEDVAFAHARPPAEARVQGVVVLNDESGPRAGVEVRVKGTALSAKSDAKGRFAFSVPPGDYELEVVTAGYRPWRGEAPKISLPVAAACASRVFTLSIDGRIEGRLTDAGGKPVAGVEVYAEAKREADRHWRLSGKTDAEGRYVIHEVPPGSFTVGVSVADSGGISPTSPYAPTWYPGVADLKKAGLVKLDRAGVTSNVDFVLPAAVPVRKVRGSVKRPDGSPCPEVYVSVVPVGGLRSTGVAVDAKGEFAVDELEGLEVVVRACRAQKCAEEKRKVTGDLTVPLVLAE